MNPAAGLPKNPAMTMVRRLIPVVLALLAVAATTPTSIAQLALRESRQNADAPAIAAEIGFAGVLWPNRWAPLTLTITGGAKAFQGELVVRYEADGHSTVAIRRPIVATPGKTTTSTVLVNVPPDCARVSVSVMRSRFSEVAGFAFAQVPSERRHELPLPDISAASPIVLGIGDPGSPSLRTVRTLADPSSNRHAIGVAKPAVEIVPLSRLAPTWASLDSVLLVVAAADSSRSADPRLLAGMREWVSSGGRLVILADAPGDAWMNWFRGLAGQLPPVSILPAIGMPPPPDLAYALTRLPPVVEPLKQTMIAGEAAATPHAATATEPEPTNRFAPAPSMFGRPISLTEAGVAAGWSIRYTGPGLPSGAGLMAEGPMGFGWVSIVGFDPEGIAGTVDNDATRCAWYDVLKNCLAAWRARSTPVWSDHYYGDSFVSGSFTACDSRSRTAHNFSLSRISDIPAIGMGFFPALAAGLFTLALLIGPIDAVVLRTLRARHRSWATAIGWIGLASLATYFLPNLIRSGDTIVNNFSVLDVRQSLPTPDGPTVAWRSGITGIFAGKSEYLGPEGALGGSWWRPLSARQEHPYMRDSSPSASRTVNLSQSLPDLSALALDSDPVGGFVPGHASSGGNLPDTAYMSHWTFRGFQDEERVESPLRARVARSAEGIWNVELHGIPPGAEIPEIALHVVRDSTLVWAALAIAERTGDRCVARSAPAAPESDTPPRCWRSLGEEQNDENYYYGWVPMAGHERRFAFAFDLPGPDRRSAGIEADVARGLAAVYLVLDHAPPGARFGDNARSRHTQVCRIVVPVAGAAPEAAPAPREEPR